MSSDKHFDEPSENEQHGDPAELLRAWKELLSSNEAANFVDTFMQRLAVLFGKTPKAMFTQSAWDLVFLLAAFACVGTLGYLQLVPDGTTGVLAGIIIGYFFKREE